MKGFIALLFSFLLTGCIDLAVNDHKTINFKKYKPKNGVVYTMRGGLGGIFSKGMNHLEDTLITKYGINAHSTVWFSSGQLTTHIIQNYNKTIKQPIVLAGHSLGANSQIGVARSLNRVGIPVALLILVDDVIPRRVPPNVKNVLNLYKPSFIPLLSGFPIYTENPQKTHVENININTLNIHVNHLTIDSDKTLQQIMLDHILPLFENNNRDASTNPRGKDRGVHKL